MKLTYLSVFLLLLYNSQLYNNGKKTYLSRAHHHIRKGRTQEIIFTNIFRFPVAYTSRKKVKKTNSMVHVARWRIIIDIFHERVNEACEGDMRNDAICQRSRHRDEVKCDEDAQALMTAMMLAIILARQQAVISCIVVFFPPTQCTDERSRPNSPSCPRQFGHSCSVMVVHGTYACRRHRSKIPAKD